MGLALRLAAIGCGVAPLPVRAAGFDHQASPEMPPAAEEILGEADIIPSLDPLYDQYLQWKERIQSQYNIEYSVQLSLLPQWGARPAGPAAVDFIWTPFVVWKPFIDTAFGSGTFTFYAQQNQYWSEVGTPQLQGRLGALTPPSDWGGNTTDYAQLTYSHTLPGAWHWLSATIGQYGFDLYDGNRYAGDAQTAFVNYALAQNATQTYGSADLGAYLEAAPASDFVLAGGFQGATNLTGSTITAHGLATGKLAYFLAVRWTPGLLAGGSYGFLWYLEPPLPEDELPGSHGLSFNAVQDVSAEWGLFLRANMATGLSSPIANSLAWGVIRNDPFGRDPLDRAGFGIARNETNAAAISAPARNAEWLAEVYYGYTVFKGLQLTPDIQLFFNPALAPPSGPAAVFTLRATATF